MATDPTTRPLTYEEVYGHDPGPMPEFGDLFEPGDPGPTPPDDDRGPARRAPVTAQPEATFEAFKFEALMAWEHAAEVDSAPPPSFLVRSVIADEDYGMLAATKKAGKTWAVADLAVSVASGTPWLGQFEIDRIGPVLLFLGEGGKRKMLRRMRAVCDSKGVTYEELEIVCVFRAPHLGSQVHLDAVTGVVDDYDPVLIIIDPLYLAARGANSSQLNEMGAQLEGIQHIAQAHRSALIVAHHWNKSGTGTGSDRMTGVGPAEWGRVNISMDLKSERTNEDLSTVAVLAVEVEGDELPDTTFVFRRHVSADDPQDLSSPLRYKVEIVDPSTHVGSDDGPARKHPPAAQRVYAVLEAASDRLSVSEIGDALAATGHPLKARTIKDACATLKADGLAESFGDGNEPWSWRIAGREVL